MNSISPDVLSFIDRLAPTHEKLGCSDKHVTNAVLIENYIVYSGRCKRCSLLYLAQDTSLELPKALEQDSNLLEFI